MQPLSLQHLSAAARQATRACCVLWNIYFSITKRRTDDPICTYSHMVCFLSNSWVSFFSVLHDGPKSHRIIIKTLL